MFCLYAPLLHSCEIAHKQSAFSKLRWYSFSSPPFFRDEKLLTSAACLLAFIRGIVSLEKVELVDEIGKVLKQVLKDLHPLSSTELSTILFSDEIKALRGIDSPNLSFLSHVYSLSHRFICTGILEGSGTSGRVFRGLDISTGTTVAIKEVAFQRDSPISKVRNEVEFVKVAHHHRLSCPQSRISHTHK